MSVSPLSATTIVFWLVTCDRRQVKYYRFCRLLIWFNFLLFRQRIMKFILNWIWIVFVTFICVTDRVKKNSRFASSFHCLSTRCVLIWSMWLTEIEQHGVVTTTARTSWVLLGIKKWFAFAFRAWGDIILVRSFFFFFRNIITYI